MKTGARTIWTFVITSIALFMVVLDNLVVSTRAQSDRLVAQAEAA